MCPCEAGYDSEITIDEKDESPDITIIPKPADHDDTIIAKATSPTVTKIPKPYPVEPNALLREDCEVILREDGYALLMQIG